MSNRNAFHGLSLGQIEQIRKVLKTRAAAIAFECDLEDSICHDSSFNGLTGWHLRSASAAVARHVWRQLKKQGVVIGESAIKAFLWDNSEELNVLPLSQMYIF